MDREQLRTLAAVVGSGTFEAAARQLHVTPSAVSQRIKALESSLGRVLVRRGTPCTPTEAGAVVVRHARQLEVLEADTAGALGTAPDAVDVLPVAVNGDSVADWFGDVLAQAAGWPGVQLHLSVEDEGHTTELLRSGEVIGAVTSLPRPVSGCTRTPLGAQRYHPVASPGLLARYGDHTPDWRRMPLVRWGPKDDLQHRLLQRLDPSAHPPEHRVPASDGYRAAVLAGLGWGLLPSRQHEAERAAGRVVDLLPGTTVDVALSWQVWTVRTPTVDRLTAAVLAAARALAPPD